MTKKIALIIIGVIMITGLAFFIAGERDYTRLTRQCDTEITALLEGNGITKKMLSGKQQRPISAFRTRAEYIEKEFLVPARIDLASAQKAITAVPLPAQLRIGTIQKSRTRNEQTLTVEIYRKKLNLYRLILRQKLFHAKIAIVLDDWGYNNDTLQEALSLPIPITYALLPNLPYSEKIAEKLRASGQEYILHLPLEPHNAAAQPLEKNTILTTMPPEEILEILRRDIASLPSLKGLNNHMGSKATEDAPTMTVIFKELKKRNLYFLDSYTTATSVVEDTAREQQVPLLQRDVFLDNENTREAIAEQLRRAKEIARKKGQAIAIGHDKHLTIATISDMAASFEKEGFTFVSLSDLLPKKRTDKNHDNIRY